MITGDLDLSTHHPSPEMACIALWDGEIKAIDIEFRIFEKRLPEVWAPNRRGKRITEVRELSPRIHERGGEVLV